MMESLIWFIIVFTLIAIPVFYLYYPYLKNKSDPDMDNMDVHDMNANCAKLTKKKLSAYKKFTNSIDSFIVTIGVGRLFFLRVVPSEEAWVIDRHGVDRVACEGINRIIPSLDRIEAEVDLKEQDSNPPPQTILTQDNISITVDMFTTFKIIEPMKDIKEVSDYKGKLETLVVTSTFTTLAGRDFVDIQKNTAAILTEIKRLIEEDSLRWGIKIMQVRFEDISPPQNIIDAEKEKIIATKNAEALKIKADAEHYEHEVHADSERVLIEKRAEATHKAISDLKKLMPDLSDEKIMQFLTSNAYIDSMKQLSSSNNSKFVLYPADVQQPMEKVMNAEYMTRNITKDN